MFFFSYTAAVIAVACLVMAAAIIFKKRDVLSFCIVMYAGGAGIWNIANAFADVSWNSAVARFWCGLALAGSMVFIIFYLIFLEQFLSKRCFKSATIGVLIMVPAVIFSVLAFSSLYIVELVFVGSTPTITVPGNINYLILVYTLAVLFYGLWRLQAAYASLSWIKKRQILYVKAGFLLVLITGVVCTIILPFLGYFMFFSLAGQSVIGVILLTAYSIYKHNFLDISIVIKRSLVFTILLFLVVCFYLALLFLVQTIFFDFNHSTYLITSIGTCFFGIFSVPKIDALLRRMTDTIFFKDSYEPAEVLARVSEILNNNLHLDDLVNQTALVLEKKLKIKYAILRPVYLDQESGGEAIYYAPNSLQDCSLILPLEKTGKQIGVLFLGSKLSGDPYTDVDIDLLKTVSHQITVALEKSRLYEQVKDYSKNLEVKIAARTVELEQLQEKQSQALFEIAHELQTPLTIIKNDLHRFFAFPANEYRAQHLEQNIDRVSRFINSLLRLARLDFVENSAIEILSLSEVLRDLVEEFEVIAQGSAIVLKYQIAEHVRIQGEKHKIIEMISNLVSNAMKYIDNDRIVSIVLEIKNNMAVLVVQDTGVGIAAVDIPYIFDRFYRGNEMSASGTGLGLAICKKIILLHRGTIRVESAVGVGTRMEVRLPLAVK